MKDRFIFGEEITICADNKLNFDEISTLMWGFCSKSIKCKVTDGIKNEIYIGNADIIPLEKDDEFTVNITKDGIAIIGADTNCLLRGFMSFLMSIITEQPINDKPVFSAQCLITHGKFDVKNRMVHICIFPETTFIMFRKLVRLCAVLQYTHIIIEFWGMLKFDCMKELAWPCAFKKDDVRKVIEEAKDLGIIPIPMFNHFGHASQSRGLNGKHVVLDQNPSLSYLFTPDGWAWDIQSEKVLSILSDIRHELYELFGEGEYIHLGCDEAYIYGNGFIEHEKVANFFERITHESVNEGRIPMLWGDMLVCKEELGVTTARYECNAKKAENARLIRNAIHKDTIINDWHYAVTEDPWATSGIFKQAGFRTMCCPWFKRDNITAAVNTVKNLELFGVVQTTWHVLSAHMYMLYDCAKKFGTKFPDCLSYSVDGMITATLMRKISFEEYSYEDTGFAAHQTGADYRNDV